MALSETYQPADHSPARRVSSAPLNSTLRLLGEQGSESHAVHAPSKASELWQLTATQHFTGLDVLFLITGSPSLLGL